MNYIQLDIILGNWTKQPKLLCQSKLAGNLSNNSWWLAFT